MKEYGFLENVDFKAISQKRLTAQGPETMLPIESKIEAEEIREFLAMLTVEEEKDFRTFMYGVKFVKSLERTA